MSKEKDPNFAPPYVVHYNKLVAFFGDDPTYRISELDEANRKCSITVDDPVKYTFLKQYLITDPVIKGGLSIDIVNAGTGKMSALWLAAALNDNPHFEGLFQTDPDAMFPFSSVVFKPEVIQYFNDDCFDPFAHKTTLMEDLVKELFKSHCRCTTAPADEDDDDDFEI